MPAQFTKVILSNSVNGRQILVSGTTSGSATAIHTATFGQTSSGSLDEIFLYASNNATSSVTCSILWGGTSEPDDVVRVILPPLNSRTLIADGKLLQNSLVVQAYSNVTNAVTIDGFVNRISPFAPANPEVDAWIDMVYLLTTASIDTNLAIATDTFVSTLKAGNVWGQMLAINTFAWSPLNTTSSNQQLSLIPLLPGTQTGTGLIPWQVVGTNPIVTRDGYSPNGNNYIQTNLSFPTLFNSDNSYGGTVYHYTGSFNAGMYFGAATNFTNMFFMQSPSVAGSGVTVCDITLANAWAFTSEPAPNPYGFYSFSRTGATTSTGYMGNSTSGFAPPTSSANAAAARSLVNNTIEIFQMNPGLSGLWYMPTAFLSFVAFHNGLTTTQTQVLYNAVQALRVAMGGGYR